MTIIPRRYRCTGCSERFEFAHREAVYHLSPEPLGTQVSDSVLYPVPVRPGWCQDCARVCLVEDIQPLRAFEAAYAAVRTGMAVRYPKETEALDLARARGDMAAYLRWRMNRVRLVLRRSALSVPGCAAASVQTRRMRLGRGRSGALSHCVVQRAWAWRDL